MVDKLLYIKLAYQIVALAGSRFLNVGLGCSDGFLGLLKLKGRIVLHHKGCGYLLLLADDLQINISVSIELKRLENNGRLRMCMTCPRCSRRLLNKELLTAVQGSF